MGLIFYFYIDYPLYMEYRNVELFRFEEKKNLPISAQKNANQNEFPWVPVVLRTGAVDHKLGFINAARIGRDQILGDIRFELEGELEIEIVRNEDDEPVSIKPLKFVFKRVG
jgi:hypothetical protein